MEVKKAQNISPNPYINNDSQNNSLNDKIDKKNDIKIFMIYYME